MEMVTIHEAETNLSRLVERVAKGESVVIAEAGKPLAKLVPLDEAKVGVDVPAARRLGFMNGEIKVPDDFDTMGADEILAMFEGRA